jgi:glycosyltransferase involved in cell wall biosynthesis
VKVLHAVDSLRTGGAEWLLGGLAAALAREGVPGEVVAATHDGADPGILALLGEAGVPVTLLDARRLHDPRLARGIARAVRRARPDVLHTHLTAANVNGRLVARVLGLPHVATIHTVPGPRVEDSRARVRADGWSARLSARIVAPSQEMADAYGRAFGLGPGRFAVIANAAAVRPPSPGLDRAALRAACGAGPGDPLALCVARLQPEKGLAELVAAAARVPGLRVAVAGEGPDRAALEAAIAAAGVGDRVRLLGRRADVGDLLAVADLFCLPSRHEGLPISLLEALGAGVPCVATAVGGVPGLLEGTGILVPPQDPVALADALAALAGDPARAAALGAAGRRAVEERYGAAAAARRHAALYAELTAPAARRGRARRPGSARSAARSPVS